MTTAVARVVDSIAPAKDDGRGLLTHSRIQTAKTCLRKHLYAYEFGLRPLREAQPLRMGSAVHLALDLLAQGETLEDVVATLRQNYATRPEWADEHEWLTECEIVVRLVCGYVWRWQGDGLTVLATEQAFEMPIVNPSTGREARNFRIAGKLDKVVRRADGRVLLKEHKTTGDSIEADSDYWRRLRIDSQVSLYMLGARYKGFGVEGILYDVIHKPGMRPKQMPVLDGDGFKIVTNETGERQFKTNNSPYQSANKAKGWTLETTLETPTAFGDRLNADIGARPDFYYRREEIARLGSDLDEFEVELWHRQKNLRECQKHGWWDRNTDACLHPYRCAYRELCFQGINPTNGDIPEGYRKLDYVHPELEGSL